MRELREELTRAGASELEARSSRRPRAGDGSRSVRSQAEIESALERAHPVRTWRRLPRFRAGHRCGGCRRPTSDPAPAFTPAVRAGSCARRTRRRGNTVLHLREDVFARLPGVNGTTTRDVWFDAARDRARWMDFGEDGGVISETLVTRKRFRPRAAERSPASLRHELPRDHCRLRADPGIPWRATGKYCGGRRCALSARPSAGARPTASNFRCNAGSTSSFTSTWTRCSRGRSYGASAARADASTSSRRSRSRTRSASPATTRLARIFARPTGEPARRGRTGRTAARVRPFRAPKRAAPTARASRCPFDRRPALRTRQRHRRPLSRVRGLDVPPRRSV
jgi:hypothetical protein